MRLLKMEFYHTISILENNNIKNLILLEVMLKFVRKQLEINNYVGPASPGADILDTLLESGNEKVLNF